MKLACVKKSNLEANLATIHKWIFKNHMVLHLGQCHYMMIRNGDQPNENNLSVTEITSNNDEKLLVFSLIKS